MKRLIISLILAALLALAIAVPAFAANGGASVADPASDCGAPGIGTGDQSNGGGAGGGGNICGGGGGGGGAP